MSGSRGGMVLIPTIIVLSLVVPVVLYVSYAAKMHVEYVTRYKDEKEALYTLRAVIRGTMSKLNSLPLLSMIGKQVCWDDLSVELQSNEGLLNLNAMLLPDNRTADSFWVSVFHRLSNLLKVPDYSERILDYIDVDDVQRADGSETGVPNRRMISKKELLLVKGMKRDYFDKMEPFLTVYSSGKINPNYAPGLLLRSLDEEMTEDVVRRIEVAREKRYIASLKDLYRIGVPAVILYRLKGYLTFRNVYFTMYICFKKRGLSKIGTVVFKKKGRIGELLYVSFE